MATIAACCGACLMLGCALLARYSMATQPRLADFMTMLAGQTSDELPPDDLPGRIGSWAQRTLHIPISPDTHRQLRLKGTATEVFLAQKVAGALTGAVLPLSLATAVQLVTGFGLLVGAPVALLCCLAGFFLPDLVLRSGATSHSEDSTEALLTFFDLVTLERLANQSATQALQSAASVSDVTIFVWIRSALERARLEQRAPFAELQRLGTELQLPALADLADVMRLDETGASLSSALRARVKELRDAHLTAAKQAAAEVSERMTVFMVLPSLIFGLIFLVPPILRLISE